MTARFLALMAAIALLATAEAYAQQVTVGTPFNTLNDSFFERQGVGFGFNIPGGGVPNGRNSGVFGLNAAGNVQPNINFNQGGANNALPPFGGFDLGTTSNVGAAILNKNANAFFNLDFGQGSTRSNVSQTPSVTLTNGVPGNFTSVEQRPFVTGVTPVVNGWEGGPRRDFFVPQYQARHPHRRPSGPPAVRSMVEQLKAEGGYTPVKTFADDEPGIIRQPIALHPSDEVQAAGKSSAGQHTASIADIQAQQQATVVADNAEARALYERGLAAAAEGKRTLAKNYFRIAAKQAGGELKVMAEQKHREMQTTGSAGSR